MVSGWSGEPVNKRGKADAEENKLRCQRFWPIGQNPLHIIATDFDRSVKITDIAEFFDRSVKIGEKHVRRILTDRSQYLFWPIFGQNNGHSVKIYLYFWQVQSRSKFSKVGRNFGQKIVTDFFRSKFSVRIWMLFCSVWLTQMGIKMKNK